VLDLESISTAGSVGFLLIFGMVNLVGLKRSKEIKGSKTMAFSGFMLCLIALAVLLSQQYHSNIIGVLVSFGLIAFCFVAEWVYKKMKTV
jgi:uncharacterized membrane protein HdeD (DUF308 family)